MSPNLIPVVALLFATSAWGSLFLVGKPLLASLDPVWFTALRYALATLLLAVLVQVFGQSPWRKLRRHATRLTLLGLAGYGCFSVLVFYGLARSLPSHGSVIMATMPFTTLLLRWALDGQRPAGASLLGAGLALLGVATVANVFGATSPSPTAEASMLVGDLVTLAGTLGWVLYTRGAASLPDHSPLEYTALTAVAATPWLLLGTVAATALDAIPAPTIRAVVQLLPPLLYIAIVPTVLAALAFNFGVRRLGPAAGTLFLNVVPISVLAVRAVQGQAPSATETAGAALVAFALGFNAWIGKRAGQAMQAGVSGQKTGVRAHAAEPVGAALRLQMSWIISIICFDRWLANGMVPGPQPLPALPPYAVKARFWTRQRTYLPPLDTSTRRTVTRHVRESNGHLSATKTSPPFDTGTHLLLSP